MSDCISSLIDAWLGSIGSGQYVGAVFLDLGQVFDLVDHRVLLHKLKRHHFTPKNIALSTPYLSERYPGSKGR